MIETEYPDEELPAQCTRSDDEARSIVLHVSSDMTRFFVLQVSNNMKKHTQRRETALERSEQMV